MSQKLFIKNMVCDRCISTVKNIFTELQLLQLTVRLGEVELHDDLPEEKKELLAEVLEKNGFELLREKNATLIEKIKTVIIQRIHQEEGLPQVNFSYYISENLHHDYNYLSTLFSSVEGITIEKYIIRQKVEKVKELISYNELSLKEIADQTGYSSVHHLSNQFKKVTGMNPTQFRALKIQSRQPLDKLT